MVSYLHALTIRTSRTNRLEDRVMVDFQQKALDHFQEQKAKIEKTREEEEKKKKIKDLGTGKVEFTDSLGRTRVVDKNEVKDLLVSWCDWSAVRQSCQIKQSFLLIGFHQLPWRNWTKICNLQPKQTILILRSKKWSSSNRRNSKTTTTYRKKDPKRKWKNDSSSPRICNGRNYVKNGRR